MKSQLTSGSANQRSVSGLKRGVNVASRGTYPVLSHNASRSRSFKPPKLSTLLQQLTTKSQSSNHGCLRIVWVLRSRHPELYIALRESQPVAASETACFWISRISTKVLIAQSMTYSNRSFSVCILEYLN
jgi:hypothetical protein